MEIIFKKEMEILSKGYRRKKLHIAKKIDENHYEIIGNESESFKELPTYVKMLFNGMSKGMSKGIEISDNWLREFFFSIYYDKEIVLLVDVAQISYFSNSDEEGDNIDISNEITRDRYSINFNYGKPCKYDKYVLLSEPKFEQYTYTFDNGQIGFSDGKTWESIPNLDYPFLQPIIKNPTIISLEKFNKMNQDNFITCDHYGTPDNYGGYFLNPYNCEVYDVIDFSETEGL